MSRSIAALRSGPTSGVTSSAYLAASSASESAVAGSPRAIVSAERSTRPSRKNRVTRARRSAGKRALHSSSSARRTASLSRAISGSSRASGDTSAAPIRPRTKIAAKGNGRLYCASSVVAGRRAASRVAAWKVATSTRSMSWARSPCSIWSARAASIAGCAQRQTG